MYLQENSLSHDFITHDEKLLSCTESGYNEYYTCSRCGYTTYEKIPPLGHTY